MRQSLSTKIAAAIAIAACVPGTAYRLYAQESAGQQADSGAAAAEVQSAESPGGTADSSDPLPRPEARTRDDGRSEGNSEEANDPLRNSDDEINRGGSQASDRARMNTSLRLRGRIDGRDSELDRTRNFTLGMRFRVGGGRGLAIDSIERNSLFFDSGLRRGDVIVSAYGRPIRSEADFVALVRSRPGVRIPVVVLRDGREEIVYLVYDQDVIERPPVVVYQEPQVVVARGFLGVMFDTAIPDAAVVRSVFPQSPAAQIGLRAGDEIIALNGEAVTSYRYAVETIEKMRAGEPIGITYRRQIENQTEAVLAPRPGTDVRTASRPVDIRVSTAPTPVVVEPPSDVRVVPVYPRRPVDRQPSLRNYR